MSVRAYADKTDVPVERSKAQISEMLSAMGATSIATLAEPERAAIAFKLGGRAYRFIVALPPPASFKRTAAGINRSESGQRDAAAQAHRQRWRALLLVLKAKMESARSGITSLDVELLPYALMPGGGTVAENVLPRLEEAYKSGRDIPLLPGV